MLLLRGLIPRHVRLEHYVGAAIFGCVTSYYTFMPFLAEQQRRRLAGEGSRSTRGWRRASVRRERPQAASRLPSERCWLRLGGAHDVEGRCTCVCRGQEAHALHSGSAMGCCCCPRACALLPPMRGAAAGINNSLN